MHMIILHLYSIYTLQHSKPQHFGKMEAQQLVAAFRSQCVEKVKNKKTEFGPRQLESGCYILYHDIVQVTSTYFTCAE